MCNSVGLELVKGFITLLNLFIILSKILFLAAVNFSVYKVACECLTSSLVQGGKCSLWGGSADCEVEVHRLLPYFRDVDLLYILYPTLFLFSSKID